MKVLHVAETIRGGVATVMRLNIEAQIETYGALNVAALVPADQMEDLLNPACAVNTFEHRGRDLRSMWNLFAALRQVVREFAPDVIHLHSTFAGFIGRLALALPGVVRWRARPKVVFCPHAWAFLMTTSGVQQQLYGLIERTLAPLADRIVCVSKFEVDRAIERGISAAKLELVYNGVPSSVGVARVADAAGPIRLLFVGRLDHQKGFDTLLEIMARLGGHSVLLTVVGDAVKSSDRPPSSFNINILGWRSTEEVAHQMQSADLLVMPSRWEGFPMVLLEAMSHGLPALTSRCSSMPEAISHGDNGYLFDLDDTESAVTLIRGLDRTTLSSLGQAARTVYLKRFTAARMTSETMALYEELV